MIDGRSCGSQLPDTMYSAVQYLVARAAVGLVQMFDRERQLFCYRLKKTDRGLVQEGISRRYTVIALLGLHQFEQAGFASPIDTKPVLQVLSTDTGWVNNIGDLGLLLWLCALAAPESLVELDSRLDVASALRRYRDARQGLTMELAWFLSGLSHWALAQPEKLPNLRALAFETYGMLRSNRGSGGLFGHVASKGSTAGWIRGRIGSLADQLYPIYAMTKFSGAYGDDAAAKEALDCARGLCNAQGPLGQWWWHYDASSGRVVQEYPVFSVHQHGMCPMTLFALGDVLQVDFGPWIYKGLRWINSENELGFDMEDASANVIWRSIYHPTFRRLWNAALNAGIGREEHQPGNGLRILFECRPYELGWLLYAFAGRAYNPQSLQTAKAQIADLTTADALYVPNMKKDKNVVDNL